MQLGLIELRDHSCALMPSIFDFVTENAPIHGTFAEWEAGITQTGACVGKVILEQHSSLNPM